MLHPILFDFHHAEPLIHALHKQNPLVHCLTNDVVQHFTANILLAAGAVPAMVIAKEEVAQFVPLAKSSLINLGTVTATTAHSMHLAAKAAQEAGIPWVLDPVAIGSALQYRSTLATELLIYNPTAIRANPSEILVLSGKDAAGKGPDSQIGSENVYKDAIELAGSLKTIVAVTGKEDYITDGHVCYRVIGGHPFLTQITGAGCALSALVAAFNGLGADALMATASACVMMKEAGARAVTDKGLGTFAVSLMDSLSLLSSPVGYGDENALD